LSILTRREKRKKRINYKKGRIPVYQETKGVKNDVK